MKKCIAFVLSFAFLIGFSIAHLPDIYASGDAWTNYGIKVDKISPQKEDTEIKLTANVEGNTSGLKYKFVWMKDNWKEWGVIRDFDNSDNVVWKPENAGDYTLYLDVMDTKGKTDTKTLDYKIVKRWTNNGINLDKDPAQKLGTTFKLTANVGGDQTSLQYKFVWMKDNWRSWGVIKDFNSISSVDWTPSETGSYTLYLDIKDSKDRIETQSTSVRIDPAKGIYGIDVSEWQGYIDWNRVKSSGVEFAMIRCGWSTGIDAPEIDKRFYENVRNAKAAGMPIGVYHYSYARTVDEARQEAEHCLDIIRKCGCTFEYPIVFDIEDEEWTVKATGGDKRIITDIVKAFCNRIEQAGYYASFYANPNWLNNYMYSDELLNRYDLWLAHWGVNEPSRNCGIWQYTSKGSVPGINGNVDLNYAYKDYLSIMRGEHLNGY